MVLSCPFRSALLQALMRLSVGGSGTLGAAVAVAAGAVVRE